MPTPEGSKPLADVLRWLDEQDQEHRRANGLPPNPRKWRQSEFDKGMAQAGKERVCHECFGVGCEHCEVTK